VRTYPADRPAKPVGDGRTSRSRLANPRPGQLACRVRGDGPLSTAVFVEGLPLRPQGLRQQTLGRTATPGTDTPSRPARKARQPGLRLPLTS